MYIKQILNNNVIIALDNSQNEIIAVAKGIGFKNKNHSIIDENDYDDLKKYVLDKAEFDEIRNIYKRIPQDMIELSSTLLEKEKKHKDLNCLITFNAVMLLADHIHETVSRLQKGLYLRNALTNEIKMFYQSEFDISMIAKEKILEKYEVILNDDEIAFIATHLINLNSNNMNETLTSIQIVDDLVNIIRRMMNIELKVNSYTYTRFITHLKYFSLRILNNQKIDSPYDKKLAQFVQENYKLPYSCAIAIKRYIMSKYNYTIANDEVIYLTIHLKNLEKEK